jgi:hypothetical protein
MSTADRPVLARDLAGTVAYASVDPTLEGRAAQDALLREIAHRRGYCWWDIDHAGFGYAVNLTMPDCSTRGYAPFYVSRPFPSPVPAWWGGRQNGFGHNG